MNIEEIKEIIKVLEKTDIVEFELEKSGVRVRIRKGSEDWMVSTGAQEKRSLKPIPSSQASAEADHAEKEDKTSQNQQLIKAPIVGTFYRSPSPDAESYVEVGTIVKKGQIVCIIEAMKLMNEIESEVDGKIIEILTENAHPVEFGEPLFAIEPQ